jgi:hypothetical protein
MSNVKQRELPIGLTSKIGWSKIRTKVHDIVLAFPFCLLWSARSAGEQRRISALPFLAHK